MSYLSYVITSLALVFSLLHLRSPLNVVHFIVSKPLIFSPTVDRFVCFVVFVSLWQREWQIEEDTMIEAMHTQTARAGTRTTLTAGVMTTTRTEDTTRSQETQTREALLVTEGANTADRGMCRLLLIQRHLLITLKDPRGCKGLTTSQLEITLTTNHSFASGFTGCYLLYEKWTHFKASLFLHCRSTEMTAYPSDGGQYDRQHRHALYNLRYILTSRGRSIFS